ncbi:MAG: hypothetical protein ACI82S_003267 [Patiriisocius sp.]
MGGDSVLEFRASDKLVNNISMAELKNKIKPHKINIFNSTVEKGKKYEAFPLRIFLIFVSLTVGF